jgi:energy-coupling factor transporter ATP-binding protein EcfA2
MHRTALANLPDHIGLRAVTANQAGKALLIVGPRCSGKTTLAVSLLLAGYDVCGDELSLVRDGQAVAFPRKFLMHGDGVELLPQLKEFADAAARPDRETLIAVDPIGLGKCWRLAPQEVSAFFLLEPNFGARTTIQPCGKLEILRQIIPHCTPPSSKRANWIADMSCTVDSTRTFIVRLGTLDSAILAMKEILGCPRPLANRLEC